jgi:nucleolar protein 56
VEGTEPTSWDCRVALLDASRHIYGESGNDETMDEDTDDAAAGWFAAVEPADLDGAIEAIVAGRADEPRDWPTRAVESGFADTDEEYYDRLHEATLDAARGEVRERERADDQQLIHCVRAMDDCEQTANELAERVSEWGSSLLETTGTGLEYAAAVAEHEPESAVEGQLVETARQSVELSERATELRTVLERRTPEVAPNLSALAGPVLATRLLALAGGLEEMAKMPSSTVQVLGAEDALFAHLRGGASSPKHGVIFTHEYVNGIDPDHRGSAARALAGKLTIAARIDHYSGDRRPELETELDERIDRIRSRSGGGTE